MPYYDTIEEDLKRAKEILEKGKAEADNDDLPEAVRAWLASQHGGTIYGADIYTAYRLLESFVAEIERLRAEVADYERSFELFNTASMALMRAYEATHPDMPENVWPDTTTVNAWAAAEIERLRVEHTRDVLRYTVKGYQAGENTDARHWRERAETAEAREATLQAEIEQLRARPR